MSAYRVTQGSPIDVPKIRDEIHRELEQATTDADRDALLAIFHVVMNAAERENNAENLPAFQKLRRQDRNLLLIRATVRPDGNVDPYKLDAITKREVDAGRMNPTDDFRKLAVAGAAVSTPPQTPKYVRSAGFDECAKILKALGTLELNAQRSKRTIFSRIQDNLAAAKLEAAVAKWRGGPIGKAFEEYTTTYVSSGTILGSYSKEYQTKLIAELYDGAAKIYAAENSYLKCRETLAGYVNAYADWQVLALKPEEKIDLSQDDPRNSHYVSGELHRHLRYCAQYIPELASLLTSNKYITDEDLIAWCNARACTFQYLMNGINVMRAEVRDIDRSREDWFRPFVKSALLAKEDDYRGKLGLPKLIFEENGMQWRHTSFTTLVVNGHANPLTRWEEIHEMKHDEVC